MSVANSVSPASYLSLTSPEGPAAFVRTRLYFIGRQFGLIPNNHPICNKIFPEKISYNDLEKIELLKDPNNTLRMFTDKPFNRTVHDLQLLSIEMRIISCNAKKNQLKAFPIVFLALVGACAIAGLTALGMIAATGTACFFAIGICKYLESQRPVFDERRLRHWEILTNHYLPELNETPKNPA